MIDDDLFMALQRDICRASKDCRSRGIDDSAIQGVITERAFCLIVKGWAWVKEIYDKASSIKGVRFTVVPDERVGWLLKVPAA